MPKPAKANVQKTVTLGPSAAHRHAWVAARTVLLAAGAAACVLGTVPAAAQPAGPPNPKAMPTFIGSGPGGPLELPGSSSDGGARTVSGPGADISGRDFAGLLLRSPVQIGGLALAGTRMAVWSEAAPVLARGAAASEQTVGDTVQRVLIEGDARVEIGGQRFSASKAVLWIETISAASATSPAKLQVAAYFDRVGEAAGEYGVQQSGDRLLVTAIVSGETMLDAAVLVQGRPDGGLGTLGAAGTRGAGRGGDAAIGAGSTGERLVIEGERRLARLLTELTLGQAGSSERGSEREGEGAVGLSGEEIAAQLPPEMRPWEMAGRDGTRSSPLVPGVSRPFEPQSPLDDPILRRRPADADLGDAAQQRRTTVSSPLFSRRGIITIAAGSPVLVPGTGPQESALIISGGVVVQYTEARADRVLQLTAQNAVIFLTGETPADLFRTSADKVAGVYLEGDVLATDGRYTVRSPRIYYDVKSGTGSMVDAVFWTYDEKLALPLYVRAKSLRQVSSSTFMATDAKVSTSSFFSPHLSMGAKSVTVTREVAPDQAARTILAARGVTANFGDLPFFYYPGFEGGLDDFPLREVGFTGSTATGYGVKTRWNLWSLLGERAPEGVATDLLVDAYSKRGGALGAELKVDRRRESGNIFAYMVPLDNGTDELPSGVRVENDDAFRAIAYGGLRFELSQNWSAFVQGAVISDELFTDAYFRSIAETERELTNALQLRYIESNQALSFVGKFSANDFNANHYLLQSQGYSVGKTPEMTYTRITDDLLPQSAPGMLTWTQEYRAGGVQMRFTKPTNAELGYTRDELAQQAFGLNAGDSLADRLRAQGFTEDPVLRVDTRQELSSLIDIGALRLEPFVTGRVTYYDNDFKEFAAATGNEEEESLRGWGGAGVRASTSVQKLDTAASSELLDINGIRHIITPNATAMTSGTNRDSTTLPVYDERVENLFDGNIVKGGVTQTWQTRRGGPGREHTADFLKLTTDVVWSPDSSPRKSPIGRFYDARPEYSVAGQYGVIDAAWQVTDSTALTAGTTYDFDLNQPARTSTGFKIDHSIDFSSFAELRFLNARDATYVDFGGQLRLTSKYSATGFATYDTNRGELQGVTGRLDREFPDVTVGLGIRYDQITDEVSFVLDLKPLAQDSRRGTLQRLRASRADAGVGEIPEVQNRSGWFNR